MNWLLRSYPNYNTLVVVLLYLACCVSFVECDFKKSWYKRYPDYPEYCSTTDQMASRTVPPFPEDDVRIGETRLLHVTAIQRHGARTPLVSASKGHQCWQGYYQSHNTGSWDCQLTTFSSPPTPYDVFTMGVDDSVDKHSDPTHNSIEFQKKYDALKAPQSNELNGTCQFGQLLLQGYEQLYNSGRHLRDAYVYDEVTRQDHSIRMRLIDTSGKHKTDPWHASNLYFRADDYQRTIMSGEILINGMLQEEIADFYSNNRKNVNSENYDNQRRLTIKVHLADRERDILSVNPDICPRLNTIIEKIETTSEFQKFNSSKESQILRNFMQQQLNISEEMIIHDCLMPIICTDRHLPDSIIKRGLDFPKDTTDMEEFEQHDHEAEHGISEQDKFGSHIFHRMTLFDAARELLYYRANDAEFAKLAMGPLWAEIIQENIAPVMNEGRDPKVKFALYSGHDTTVMPLLATLGPNVWKNGTWPTYAAMVLLEIHEFVDGQTDRTTFPSTFAFRLIYNGQVITSRIEACPQDAELCDLQVLMNIVQPFATRHRDCREGAGDSGNGFLDDAAMMNDIDEMPKHSKKKYTFGMATNIGLLVVTIVFGMSLGALVTFVHMEQRFPKFQKVVKNPNPDNDGIMLTSTPFSDKTSFDSNDNNNSNGDNGNHTYGHFQINDDDDDDDNFNNENIPTY